MDGLEEEEGGGRCGFGVGCEGGMCMCMCMCIHDDYVEDGYWERIEKIEFGTVRNKREICEVNTYALIQFTNSYTIFSEPSDARTSLGGSR